MRIGVIFGGKSGEHEVSLMSATSIINAMDKDKYEIVQIGITKEGQWLLYEGAVEHIETGHWQEIAEKALRENPHGYRIDILGVGGRSLKEIIDFAFPILHGPNGEDGTIQGLFEMIDIPYSGCAVLPSAVAMDKCMAKELFIKAGLPVCKYQLVEREHLKKDITQALEQIEKELPYPVFVKPANMGSSVGVSKAKDREQLKEALETASIYDRRLIVEEGLNCRELETGILGNYLLEAAVVGEIIASHEFYDYEAKYFDDGKSIMSIPANISSEISDEVKSIALKAYKALDCCGYARVDFFLQNTTNKVIINEINTIPGFTKYSMFPCLWESAGLPYGKLIERIIELGYERHNDKNHR